MRDMRVKTIRLVALLFSFGLVSATNVSGKTDKGEAMQYRFDGVYEPSAVQHVAGSNFLLVEDERGRILHHLKLAEGKKVDLQATIMDSFTLKEVEDFEGLVKGPGNTFIAAASHSRARDGSRKESREQLVQFHFDGRAVTELKRVEGLRDSLIQEVQKLGLSLKEVDTQLNIEGIAFSPSGKNLLLGLRAPLVGGKAVVLQLLNIDELILGRGTAQFAPEPYLLDLGGGGVRGMGWSETSGHYYFTTEARNKKDKMRARLYRWDGKRGNEPRRLTFPGLKNLKNIEGVSFFSYRGEEKLLLVCDDGEQEEKKGAHYAIISVKDLSFKQ